MSYRAHEHAATYLKNYHARPWRKKRIGEQATLAGYVTGYRLGAASWVSFFRRRGAPRGDLPRLGPAPGLQLQRALHCR